jgi:hypothetical protein
MAPWLFRALLALVAVYALLRGSRDERQVALICILGALLTHYSWSPLHGRLAGLEEGVLTIDLAVFAGFLAVALRSNRFWPLWIAGLQLTTLLGHVLKAADTGLFSRAYGAALMVWSYPIILILLVGTWRGERRARRQDEAASV